ncbi:MAG: hypothetical protein ACRY3E_02665 [Candidatus Lariskella arthropodorum]
MELKILSDEILNSISGGEWSFSWGSSGQSSQASTDGDTAQSSAKCDGVEVIQTDSNGETQASCVTSKGGSASAETSDGSASSGVSN